MAAKKGGLGKGLEALFDDNRHEPEESGIRTLKIGEIEPNKNQPRKQFAQESLTELADSVREHGILQPLIVTPNENGRYLLVAGERRWRAARMAGLTEVPVIIKEMTEEEILEVALIENLQREDLNPIEEAEGYKTLMDGCGMTQDQVASKVGKSRPVIANSVRLLGLPSPILTMLVKGEISSGHGRALLAIDDEMEQLKAARDIVKKGLTVRDVERMAKKKDTKPPKAVESSFYKEMEIALTAELGRKVTVKVNQDGKGSVEVPFYSKQELAELASRIVGKDGRR